jgi:hypothetical protein
LSKERSHLAMMTMLAHAMAAGAYEGQHIEFPDVAGYPPRPEGYGVHLSKAERKGKTPAQLQAMRQKIKQEEKSNG